LRILVTGVQGFIGSHLARGLLAEDNYVLGIARSHSSAGAMRIADIASHPRFSLRHLDLAGDVSGVTENVDLVFHLAALTFVDHSIRDPAAFIRNNYLATFNILEDARRNSVGRFVQVSTDEVYGPIIEGQFAENAALLPSNPYAASKGGADLLLGAYHKTYGFPGLIARVSNVYGTWQHPQKAIPTFVRHALRDEALPLFGDGKQRRAWIAVEDVCTGLWTIGRRGRQGEIYHVASQFEVTNLALAEMILKHLGKSDKLIRFILDRDVRPGHDWRYALSTAKIEALGWMPQRHFGPTLCAVVDWFAHNEAWLAW
jgi:dTDP-glucose 4,6-dehydratase